MAKQHQVRGEDANALKMYQLALPHFPDNAKLVRKVAALEGKVAATKSGKLLSEPGPPPAGYLEPVEKPTAKRKPRTEADESYHEAQDTGEAYEEDEEFIYRPRTKIRRPQNTTLQCPPQIPPLPDQVISNVNESEMKHSAQSDKENCCEDELTSIVSAQTPRTRHILQIINSKDVSQIQLLKGVGSKRAEAIVSCLCDLNDHARVSSLRQLETLKGVGVRTVENMRVGLTV